RYIPVCSVSRRADKSHIGSCLEEHTSVLSLADRLVIDEHHYSSFVNRACSRRQLLPKGKIRNRSAGEIFLHKVSSGLKWSSEQRSRYVLPLSQPRRKRPRSPVWVTTHVKNNRRSVHHCVERLLRIGQLQPLQIDVAVSGRQHLIDLWGRALNRSQSRCPRNASCQFELLNLSIGGLNLHPRFTVRRAP